MASYADDIGAPATGPGLPKPQGLYHPRYERDACGVGFVCHIGGRPSHHIIEQGIDAGRLESEGYGPDKPIASNKTARGKAQNRRTEFRILGRD